MDEGELSMEQAKELTAKYICGNEEWLKIALDVYLAREAVRWRLIEQIWQGVEKRVCGDGGDGIKGAAYKNGFWFWHEEAENFGIYGEVEQGRGTVLYLIVGIYLADGAKLNTARREEIRQCYNPTAGKQSDPKDHYLVKDYVGHDRELDRWDWDSTFLRQAINERDMVESYLADLLLSIYHRTEGVIKRIAKDVWA